MDVKRNNEELDEEDELWYLDFDEELDDEEENDNNNLNNDLIINMFVND